MKILNKKIAREIFISKGQWLAIIIIIVIGLVAFNGTYVSYQNLNNSKNTYFEKQNFASLWFNVVNAPVSIVSSIKEVDGVKDAQGRITLDVSLNLSGVEDRFYGRIHSYSITGQRINKIFLLKGHFIKDEYSEVLLEKQFAEYHNLNVGDEIFPIINGEKYNFKIAGIIASPEYVYNMRSSKDIMPDAGRFGIIFASSSLVKSIWAKGNMINEVLVTLEKKAREEKVINEIEDILDNYGLKSSIKQKNQLSNVMLQSELDGLEGMAYIFPLFFLVISAVIIYIILNRIIENQRSQIGLLKSLGFSSFKITVHYLSYGIIVCLLGGVLGGIIGQYVGLKLTEMYTHFFNIPVLKIKVYWLTFCSGLVLALLFGFLGGWQAVKKISKLPPAQALRPAVPTLSIKKLWIEKLEFFGNLGLSWRYAFRNLMRNKSRTFITILGVAISVGLMISTAFFLDSIDYLLNKHYKETESYDMRVVLEKPLKETPIINELENIREIYLAEPYLEVPVKIKYGWQEENIVLVGIKENSHLYNIQDEKGRALKFSQGGVILSHIWKEKLGVNIGDIIKIKHFYGKDKEVDLKVVGFTKQYLEFNGFLNIKELNEIIKENKVTNNILLKVEYQKNNKLRKELYKLPNICFVESSNYLKEKFKEYLELTYLFLGVIVFFGGAIAISIVYVTNSISIFERRSELALLRTIGFSSKELAEMIFKENIVVNLLGLLIGYPLGYGMAEAVAKSYGQEVMVIPVVIYPRTYILISLIILLFMLILCWPNIRYIENLKLVEVLKNREG